MQARRILARLRHQQPLDEADLTWFAKGLASGEVSDAQGAAFAMAVCRNGMSEPEMVALTRAMRDSGRVLTWDLPGPVLDKHSTGGLGDATSIVLAPLLAALGCYCPMLSGRGLGHTGGTLDKLEAVPGVSVDLSEVRLREIVARVGCAIVSASDEIAPADRRLYALRDETSTVDSQPLITASILAKKLAAGTNALILDVKGGSGAFMKTRAEAETLARALVGTAQAAGTPTRALITDMNQPLAPAIGNAVEMIEVISVLTSPMPEQRLCQLSLVLAGELLALAGVADSPAEGGRRALEALHSGAAAEKFAEMIREMGGPADLIERARLRLPTATVVRDVHPETAGQVAGIDGKALGDLVVALGGGRARAGDRLNYAVGLSEIASLGDTVDRMRPLARVHAADDGAAVAAIKAVRAAFHLSGDAVVPPLIHGRID